MTPFDAFPPPPCATLLGWTLLDHDNQAGTIRVGFDGRAEFANPAGFVQGGMLAAMLDDTMGAAVFAATGGRLYTVTIGMNVSYLAPARPGRLTGEGRILQLGKTVAFVEGVLSDADGRVLARATAHARLVETARLAA
jgi:uncharacterized protein (TIGR00369 family)